MADELLTETEHRLIEMLGDCFNLYREVLGAGPTRRADLLEATAHIHALQARVMAQAAARAYPERYRLLGEDRDSAAPQ
jgi:hypothetical protein